MSTRGHHGLMMSEAGGSPAGAYLGNVITKITSATSTHAISLGTVVPGTLLILQWTAEWGVGGAVYTPAGWTLITNAAGGTRQLFCYRIADGSEGATVNVIYQFTAKGIAIVHHIAPGAFHVSTAPAFAWAKSTSASPNPPNLAPSWGSANTLWLATCHVGGSPTVTAWPLAGDPTADRIQVPDSTATIASCWQQSVASSFDPAAFALSASKAWMAQTLGIRPA